MMMDGDGVVILIRDDRREEPCLAAYKGKR